MPAKQQLSYADIAVELGTTRERLQQFVAEERRTRGNPWTPDASPAGSVQHYFSRQKAEQLKRAWTERRVLKTWKKEQPKPKRKKK